MNIRSLLAALTLALIAGPVLATPLDDAIALYDAKKFPEARAALEKLTAAEPTNAAAAHHLGLTLLRRGDASALNDAVPWLAKAAELEPTNATYLADFGGPSMQLAGKTKSLTAAASAANKGKEAMIKSLEINPDNLDAHEGLMQFYLQAPWPMGSSSKAGAQAEEIAKRDPARGFSARVALKLAEKKYPEASALCEAHLKTAPDFYPALFQIGRLASMSGENLDRGLVTLRRCLELTPPSNQPGHSGVHYRIGVIMDKKGDTPAARLAYEAALKLDPASKTAAAALAKLTP